MTVRVDAAWSERRRLTWVRCRLVSDLANSKGEVFGEREHHEARVRLVEKCDDLCPFLQREVDELPQIGTPPPGELLHPASFIYDRYFHGPDSNLTAVFCEALAKATAWALTVMR